VESAVRDGRKTAGRILRKLKGAAGYRWHILSGLLDARLNPFSERTSRIPPPDHGKIRADLEATGLAVVPMRIDTGDFRAWLKAASFPQAYESAYGDVFTEKALEHYAGARLLEPCASDILIDVAASHSPWAGIAERLYGCKAYALDLQYPPGINGKRIGADATAMPLPDGFATKMALHCAYETFEGDADIRLLPEAWRVLRPGGRMAILPLYLHNVYFADSHPLCDRRALDYHGARRTWRGDGNRVRFSRKYSPDAFVARVVRNLGRFRLTIVFFENEKDVAPGCYLKFAAIFEK
jgi:SAM-dependent methyltransferase